MLLEYRRGRGHILPQGNHQITALGPRTDAVINNYIFPLGIKPNIAHILFIYQ